MTTTLVWPRRSCYTESANDVRVGPGELLDVDDPDRVDQLLDRGFEVADDDDMQAANAETDPDDVGGVIDRFVDELPNAPGHAAGEIVALRDAYYFIKQAGETTADAVSRAAWDGNTTLKHQHQNRTNWWAEAAEPFLPILPGIVREGTSWRYDPTADEDRPAVPSNPVDPSPADVDAALDCVQWPEPNVTAHLANRNRRGVEDALAYLQEHGEASTADLKGLFTPTDISHTGQAGLFDNPDDWARACLRPAMREVPWVNTPRVAGQEFRYLGVQNAGETTDDVTTTIG